MERMEDKEVIAIQYRKISELEKENKKLNIKVASLEGEIKGLNSVIDKLKEELSAYDREYFDEDKKAEHIFMEEDTLNKRLEQYGVQIQLFNIVNFDFSKSFNDAIEAKVTAEQEALAEKNKLEKVKYESEQKIVAAEAQAKAIEIQAKAIQSQGGKEYVNLKWVEKWDGKLPETIAGGDSSFIMMMDK